MKPAAWAAFLEWYNKKIETESQFNFDKELLDYCHSDVQVLWQCCMKFRDILMEETDVDPFEKSITIASTFNLVFQYLFLKPNSIGKYSNSWHRKFTQFWTLDNEKMGIAEGSRRDLPIDMKHEIL
uniref:DNA-directed DNA polymerase n=1 Tax=Romanomermis culicivorax TaxID=13658 RepID=A0A915HNU0_ROMCU